MRAAEQSNLPLNLYCKMAEITADIIDFEQTCFADAIVELFDIFDTNRNGFINRKEFLKPMKLFTERGYYIFVVEKVAAEWFDSEVTFKGHRGFTVNGAFYFARQHLRIGNYPRRDWCRYITEYSTNLLTELDVVVP